MVDDNTMKTRLKRCLSDSKILTSWLHIIFLVVCSYVVLVGLNADLLYAVQDQSLFLSGRNFFSTCSQHLGGVLIWVSRYMTQWLYYPWLGASALILIWVVCYLLSKRIFALTSRWSWLCLIPVISLLISTVDLGYWIYYIKHPAYWFRESLGLLIVLLLLIPRLGRANAVMSLVAISLYGWIGWYAVLAVALLMLRQLLTRDWINGVISVVLLLVVPGAIARSFDTQQIDETWTAGFPMIETFGYIAWGKTMPFIVLVLSLFAMQLLGVFLKRDAETEVKTTPIWRHYILHAVTMLVMAVVVVYCNYGDYNYHAELRIKRACEESRWDKVLEEIDHAPLGPTRQMVMAKNLALLHTGYLGDLMFAFPNSGPKPMVDDSLRVFSAQTFASLYYLKHGLANDAIHWCFENGVEYGFTVEELKTLSLASILQGEYQVARKYLEMLGRTSFHRGFAVRYYPLISNPDLINDYPELQLMKELHDDINLSFEKDDGLPEWRVYTIFANQAEHISMKAAELALSYSMMLKNYEMFWHHLYRYCRRLKKGDKLSLYYQEAAYLGCQLDPANHPESDFRFDSTIAPRYKMFHSKAKHPSFEPNYWWFFYFCTNVQTY